MHNTKVKSIKLFAKYFDLNNSKQIANSPFYFYEEINLEKALITIYFIVLIGRHAVSVL